MEDLKTLRFRAQRLNESINKLSSYLNEFDLEMENIEQESSLDPEAMREVLSVMEAIDGHLEDLIFQYRDGQASQKIDMKCFEFMPIHPQHITSISIH